VVGVADDMHEARERMVREQLVAGGIRDPRVLEAMRRVPRHAFVPDEVRARAYEDGPLPIGYMQTISQPFIVALMCELAALRPDSRVLELGTGCGYQAAVLAELAADVYTIEIVEPLAQTAAARLAELGYGRVHVRYDDGSTGWPEVAPFDAVLVAAATAEMPDALLAQLAPGGRAIVPVGPRGQLQELRVYRRTAAGIEMTPVCPVAFVPLTGPSAAR
jgi:protein-L-isoaspartate(D-aspartate) O-methyltransferase